MYDIKRLNYHKMAGRTSDEDMEKSRNKVRSIEKRKKKERKKDRGIKKARGKKYLNCNEGRINQVDNSRKCTFSTRFLQGECCLPSHPVSSPYPNDISQRLVLLHDQLRFREKGDVL